MRNAALTFILAAGLTAAAFAQTAGEPALAIQPNAKSLSWGPCPPVFMAGCEIAVLHGDPAKPNADVFLRVPAGYVLAAHAHSSAERMVLVTGQLEVRYRGQKAAMLKVGDYAYGPAKAPHEGKCVSAAPCTLFIAFEGPVDADLYGTKLD